MLGLKAKDKDGEKQYLRTPADRLYEEMAFLGYYMHWSHEELMNLDHKERRRWCKEVSGINKKISGTPQNVFDRI